MRPRVSLFVTLFAFITSVASREGLHLGTYGLLQVPPSFSGDGITLYPAHHPDHDSNDLNQLTPEVNKKIYYTQEGHRPAIHGAKHGSMNADFSRPTVILDHTNQVLSIQCRNDHNITVCLTPDAFEHAQETWNIPELNLVTYHVGCGDEYSGVHSYFHVTSLDFHAQTQCIDLVTEPIEQSDAVHSGEISWGTYIDPAKKKRFPVQGHVRVSEPTDPWEAQKLRRRDPSALRYFEDGNATLEELVNAQDDMDLGDPMDLNENGTAIADFFGIDISEVDMSEIDEPVPDELDLDFIEEDGTVGTPDEENNNLTRRNPTRTLRRRKLSLHEALARRRQLEERGIVDFFRGLYEGIKSFFQSIEDLFKKTIAIIESVAKLVVELAVITAKLIAVPFGVPFDHTYHNDIKFTYVVKGEASNKPPTIFGISNGATLDSSSGTYTIQCAKCGIHGDFSVDGRLAFSLSGVTQGTISLINKNPFTIDAIFGITLEKEYSKPIKGLSKQLAAVPLSPFTIPGIITFGPQISISSAVDLSLSGKAELLIGGSLSISAGTATLDLVTKRNNKLDGFVAKFVPVAQFTGTLTATIEFSLPISLEVGLDILNGKFKKSVGLVNKPSVYASATVSNKDDAACKNGVEIRVGARNHLYVQAFDIYSYDIRKDDLYEQGLTCVTANGFDSDAVEPAKSVFVAVTTKLKTKEAGVEPIKDIAATLPKTESNVGFRIIMDEAKTSILVSGNDGQLYLVPTDAKYDISAPWGTINLKSNGVDLDVFGRILTYLSIPQYPDVYIAVRKPAKVPNTESAAALTILKGESKDYNVYGLTLTNKAYQRVIYTTFCPSDKGLKLVGTPYLIDDNGNEHRSDIQKREDELSGRAVNRRPKSFEKCRTIRLTSPFEPQPPGTNAGKI